MIVRVMLDDHLLITDEIGSFILRFLYSGHLPQLKAAIGQKRRTLHLFVDDVEIPLPSDMDNEE